MVNRLGTNHFTRVKKTEVFVDQIKLNEIYNGTLKRDRNCAGVGFPVEKFFRRYDTRHEKNVKDQYQSFFIDF